MKMLPTHKSSGECLVLHFSCRRRLLIFLIFLLRFLCFSCCSQRTTAVDHTPSATTSRRVCVPIEHAFVRLFAWSHLDSVVYSSRLLAVVLLCFTPSSPRRPSGIMCDVQLRREGSGQRECRTLCVIKNEGEHPGEGERTNEYL